MSMPTAIQYENLTYPEVAALPRDIPLVLPLGDGYDADAIGRALGEDTCCILPALPYGWRGSLLEVQPETFARVLVGLWQGPKEEHFSRLVLLHAGEERWPIEGVEQIRLPRPHAAESPTIQATPQRVVLISAGHTEQHGFHLPMNVDTVIIGAIMAGVCDAIPDEAEMLPAWPYGVSMFRSSFAGTFTMGGRAFEDFFVDVVSALVARGADRFYLNSGHGGNGSFFHNAVKYAGNLHRGIFAATTFLHTSGRIGGAAIDELRTSAIGGMGHAGELETAYMLHLRPELCHMDRAVDETDFVATDDYYNDWIEGGALIASPPWEDDTTTGSYGAGSVATAEKGRLWLQAAVEEKIAHVREIHEQQNRRIARRKERGIDYSKSPGTKGD